jgi:hypothetical protein
VAEGMIGSTAGADAVAAWTTALPAWCAGEVALAAAATVTPPAVARGGRGLG